ncbi:MAG: glutamate-5-semialdehyde dehydrogenase [Cyanobacteria bacterium]|nr:glutamate-5-semialdehyde dehydrogenase [Cyanobacteriota bacterium]
MTASFTAVPTPLEIARQTRRAARTLAVLPPAARDGALMAIADALENQAAAIVAANEADCAAAIADGLSNALYGRLKLDGVKLQGAIAGVRDVAKLPDPIGTVQLHRQLDEGLILKRLTCPLGVLGVIFEARPDAAIQIAALAIKSGNGVILKGGREAARTCTAIVETIHQALATTAVSPEAVQLLTTREETIALLKLDEYIDLIVPRGSNEFVRYIQDNTRIPVLGHADGICHLYVHGAADQDRAIAIAVDAKTQYPSACNAIETLLVDRAIAAEFLPQVGRALQAKGVELRADEAAYPPLQTAGLTNLAIATDEDWSTEYTDLILAIKVVDGPDDAIAHINHYGSGHTDAIVTEDAIVAAQFLAEVDAAGVYHNCSTRFADGFRYGFGAEVGISTAQMPPRGPVGLEGLVTYKYRIVGQGHIAATYSGPDAKPFQHQDLPPHGDTP